MHILFTHFRRFRSGFIQVCFCLGILLLGGCDMIEYHPYDLDIDGETDVNRRNIERIETATYGKEEIRFAVISDTQRWYDETEDAVEALNRRDDLDFVLHTGYMSDFGLKLEFEKMGIIIDKSCSDITRLRLASYDKHPYLNWDAVPYEKTLDENDCVKVRDLIKTEILQDNIADNKVNDFDFVANQLLKPTNLDLAHVIPQSKKNEVVRLVNVIIESKVDITRNYQDWFTICCIIKNYFGAGGIALFHDISKLYPNYSPEETEKLYSSIKQWQYRYRSDRLFEIAAKYGIL